MSKIYVDEIHPKTSGSHVLMPGRVAFLASFQSSGVALSNVGPDAEQIVFNRAVINIGNCYNTSTGYFTAPVGGVYTFNWDFRLQEIDSAINYFQIYTTKNDTPANGTSIVDKDVFVLTVDVNSDLVADSSYRSFSQSSMFSLVAGDTIKITYSHNGGADQVDINGESHFMGYLIG